MSDDPRLSDAKRLSFDEVMDRVHHNVRLTRSGREWVGPCPACGGYEKPDSNRFSVNKEEGIWHCRKCPDQNAGDFILLAQKVLGKGFLDTLDHLVGPKREETAEEKAARKQREADAAKKRAQQEAEAKRRREAARREANDIWMAGVPWRGTETEAYLQRRGIPEHTLASLGAVIRHHPDLPYLVARDGGRRWVEVHRGPAMLAAVQMADGRFGAVHRTWLDLSQAKGKAKIIDPETGEEMATKKGWGIKKGGAIRLLDGVNSTLVMGEGIETTLSVHAARLQPIEGSAFWAGVDLGNMSGQRKTGKGMMYAGLPRLSDDEAFVPPAWVKRLVYLMDGDSDPRDTKAKLQAGCRRAMKLRPGLEAFILPAPQGADFNDVLMGVAP